jgi:hypothetical protein
VEPVDEELEVLVGEGEADLGAPPKTSDTWRVM